VEGQENWNIWQVSLERGHLGAPQRFLASTGQNHSPSYSPNGKTIAFVSDRSGNPEIWTCDADGKQLRQLTHFGGPWLGTIRWSPDGKKIVFDARPQGHSAVYVMDLESNAMQVLEMQPFEVRRPSWSRDGKSLYYDSTTKGLPQVWKHDLASGHNQLVAPAGSMAAIEDLSGQHLMFVDTNYHRVWVADTDGADAHVLDEVTAQPALDWAPTTNGLLYLVSSSQGADVFSYSFREGRSRKLGSLPQMLAEGTPSVAISPDQRTLLYATIDQRISEIKLRRALSGAPAH
jgi:Tol biopolymer transport system component